MYSHGLPTIRAVSEPATAAAEWLAATGAPNWVVVVAMLTHPSTWTDAALKHVRPALDRMLPTREKQ